METGKETVVSDTHSSLQKNDELIAKRHMWFVWMFYLSHKREKLKTNQSHHLPKHNHEINIFKC